MAPEMLLKKKSVRVMETHVNLLLYPSILNNSNSSVTGTFSPVTSAHPSINLPQTRVKFRVIESNGRTSAIIINSISQSEMFDISKF